MIYPSPSDETGNFVKQPSPFDRLIRPLASGMFQPLLNALKLAKLQNERSQVLKAYEAYRKRLLDSGLSDEEASSKAALMHKGDIRVTYTNIEVFLSDRLVEQA